MRTDAMISAPAPGETRADRSSAAPVLDVRDLTVRLKSRDIDLTLLHGVSFTLRQGDVMCLLGESGSGKSVTLRSLIA